MFVTGIRVVAAAEAASESGISVSDVVVALIGVAGVAIAAAWPSIQAAQRRRRFTSIIRRELEEVGPYSGNLSSDAPWWFHLQKRFTHEELLRNENLSSNRDFVLSLRADVVYNVTQLWAAFDARNGEQWLHFLERVSTTRSLRSDKLTAAVLAWTALLAQQPEALRRPPRVRSASTGSAGMPEPVLLEARLAAYQALLPLTRRGSVDVAANDLAQHAAALIDWYYKHGLLLSGNSLRAFQRVRGLLDRCCGDPPQIDDAFSALRTELKIDLGIRDHDERHIPITVVLPSAV